MLISLSKHSDSNQASGYFDSNKDSAYPKGVYYQSYSNLFYLNTNLINLPLNFLIYLIYGLTLLARISSFIHFRFYDTNFF